MKNAFLLLFAVLCSICQTVYADGGFIPTDPSVYYSIVEDQQIAVIDVKDTKNVAVDMFISLTDESNKSNDITFFLPFYTKPKDFNVEEKDSNAFAKEKTQPLDKFIRESSAWKDDAKSRILLTAVIGWATSGGPVILALPFWQLGVFKTGGSSGIESAGLGGSFGQGIVPEEIITTEHSRTEVYKVSAESDLEYLLSKSGLTEDAKAKIRDYKGTYLYFISLKTIPSTVDQRGYERDEGLNSLGMHFSYKTELRDGVYTYPLGTGKTWANPIKLTRVYVRNPRDLTVNIDYPKMGEKADRWDYYSAYDIARMGGAKWDFEAGDDTDYTVSRISYLSANPDKDVKITISERFAPIALLEKTWAFASRPLYSIILPLMLMILPLLLWSFFFKKTMTKVVEYPSKFRLYLNALLYFIINSIIQTSLSWLSVLALIAGYVLLAMLVSMMRWYDYSAMSQITSVFLLLMIPAFLAQLGLGILAVSFIYKLHNKLEKMPYKRLFATYILTLICFFAAVIVAYFTI